MVTVTISFGPKTRNYTISAANITRLQNWINPQFPTIPNPAYNPTLPPDPVTNPPRIANPEPVLSYIDSLWASIKQQVREYEQNQTKQAVPLTDDLT